MYIIIYYDVLVTTTKVLVTLLIASRVRPQAMTKLYTIIAITPVGRNTDMDDMRHALNFKTNIRHSRSYGD